MMDGWKRQCWGASGVLGVVLLALVPAFAGAQPYAPTVTLGNPVDPVLSSHDCNDPENPVANCGFETGTFDSWVTKDAAAPFFALVVDPGGTDIGFGFFVSAPSEGSWTALHGFDAGSPDTIEIGQDVTIPPGATGNLLFDYRGAWDMTFGATLDRTFEVHIEPAGGGAPMQTDLILTAQAGSTNLDTGNQGGDVDVSAFLDQTVRVNFVWTIPESFTGPGFFQLDNVLIDVVAPEPIPVEIPTLTSVGFAVLVLLLMAVSLRLLARRRSL